MRPLPAEPAENPVPPAAVPPPAVQPLPAGGAKASAAPSARKPTVVRPVIPSLMEDPLYPSADGEPMAENVHQYQNAVDLYSVLNARLGRRPDVVVAGNFLIYFEKGDPTKRVAPDVFVAFDVLDHSPMSYKLWERGKAPDFVLELGSPSTWREDLGRKRGIYERLGVREYWLFDATGGLYLPRLQCLVLQGGKYRALPARVEKGRRLLRSEVLGLDLLVKKSVLRFQDPETKECLRTLEEEAAARREVEAACQSAEARAADLAAQLRAAQSQLDALNAGKPQE